MSDQEKEQKKRKKAIQGAFIITLAIAATLAYNAVLLYYDQDLADEQPVAATEDVSDDADTYILSDVAEHDDAESCWMAAYGNVYDVTEYVQDEDHPGGQGSIISGCGEEVTHTFDRIHSAAATELFAEFKIGVLVE